jgi:hypothetical protein
VGCDLWLYEDITIYKDGKRWWVLFENLGVEKRRKE